MNPTKSILLLVLVVVALVEGGVYPGEGYKALEFRGSNWAQIPKAASQFAGKQFSFECWIMLPQADSRTDDNQDGIFRPIVSRYNSSVQHPSNYINDFNLGINPEGQVVFFVGGSDELGFVMASASALESNRWYHVAFAIEYDDINSDFPRSATLYVDNWFNGAVVRDRQNSVWYGPGYPRIVLTDEFIALGMYQNDDQAYPLGQYFIGTIDEVRLWKGRRLASEFLNYANRTINNLRYDIWAITPEQGGVSSDELVFSYNFNDANPSQLTDRSANGFHATLLGGPLSHTPNYVAAQEKITTFAYAIGQIPTLITLYGVDSTNLSANVAFKINFDPAVLKGELYLYDSRDNGVLGAARPQRPDGIQTPGIGSKIDPGQIIHQSQIVYVYIPQSGVSTGKFFYAAASGATPFGDQAEVRIPISCNQDSDQPDDCGICNGENFEKDECGVCFGDGSSCAGCDGVPNSGIKYDECGVCDGDNTTCLGCDGKVNSHTTYDDCGVCGGKGNTCGGCDGHGSVFDECNVCNGTNSTCAGCDGVPHSGLQYDKCGVCDGDGSTCAGCDGTGLNWEYDECGVCGGDDSSCTGCDGVLFSGYEYDFCGECGGNNGTCIGCDGSGGGEYDECGVCRGDGSTCGGCDGKGGHYDFCGVCAGDNSTCTCIKYHGYEVEELEYTLLQWNIQHTIRDIDTVIADLDESLTLLQDYTGDLDLASVVLYFNHFLNNNLKDYEQSVDAFIRELDISLGVLWDGKPINPPGFPPTSPYYTGNNHQ